MLPSSIGCLEALKVLDLEGTIREDHFQFVISNCLRLGGRKAIQCEAKDECEGDRAGIAN